MLSVTVRSKKKILGYPLMSRRDLKPGEGGRSGEIVVTPARDTQSACHWDEGRSMTPKEEVLEKPQLMEFNESPCGVLSKDATTEEGNGERTLVQKIKAFFCSSLPCKRSSTPRTRTPLLVGLAVLGVLFCFSAVGFCIMWFTDLYISGILKQLTLREGSQVFDAWSAPPVKPLICAHVFNYTNVHRYAAGVDPKIHVQEVGPYCYRETQSKKNITFNDDGTVTYGDLRRHEFEPKFSNGSKDDILIVPNLPLISAMAMCKDLNYISRKIVSQILHGMLSYSNTMVTVKAHDLFFGYDDRLVEVGARLAAFLQKDIPFKKFGLLMSRAAVTDDTVTVDTGNRDLDKIGMVTEVNGRTKLDVWSDEECNRIDGSDGAFFPKSDINETSTLYLFHKDLCRRMPFVYDKEVEFQDGVMAMRFHASPSVYDTEGTCYCPSSGCAPNGVFDLSPCTGGAPVLMSFPHFLYADPALREPFEGLHPDPQKHEFYIDIQRLLGFTLGTVSRLQLNAKIVKPRGLRMLKEFPENIILPIVWIQVSAQRLPPQLFNFIYHASVTVIQVQSGLQWFTVVCCLTTALGIALLVRRIPPTSANKKPPDSKEIQHLNTQLDTDC